MKHPVLFLALLASLGAAEPSLPKLEQVISERFRGLPAPIVPTLPRGVKMAVTATGPDAQGHVLDGLTHLQGGWDLEAYRHFCSALRLDPECLMAHWGIVVALIDPEPDLADERDAALARMVDLVERGVGSELERSYALGLALFFHDGAAAAAKAFSKMSEKFPNDPQLRLMAAAFGRTGYEADGTARPDQKKAEEWIEGLLASDPDHPLYLIALLTIRAEAPHTSQDLERARRLGELAPNYPPALHLLGHYESRGGHWTLAIAAFGQAADAYGRWMGSMGMAHVDCPGWVKAECCRAAALAAKGDYPIAFAVAGSIAEIDVPAERAASAGGWLLMWEGRTLEARLRMRRSLSGDVGAALASLPDPKAQQVYKDRSRAMWWYQGLAIVLEARKALEEGDFDKARKISDALALHGEAMSKSRATAAAAGERSAWNRAFVALEISACELRGLMAMAGPKEGLGSAFNWYRAALDRQTPPSLLMPPALLLPMSVRLAEYHLARGEAELAIAVLNEAQARHPRDSELLIRLQKALAEAGRDAEAEKVAGEIERMKSE